MPFVTLTTNIPDEQLPHDLNQSITNFLSKLFSKPASDFSVIVDAGKRFTIGGGSGPAVMIVVGFFGKKDLLDQIHWEFERDVEHSFREGNFRIHLQSFTSGQRSVRYSLLPV